MNWRKQVYMLRKLALDLRRSTIPFEPNKDNFSAQLGYYYFRFEEEFGKLNRLIACLDADGIPLNTTYVDVAEPQLHYYPISIGQYGLAVFHTFLKTGREDKRAHFLRIADWFVKNAQHDKKLGVFWLTAVPKPEYHLFTPWKSAFAQSRALSILLRAWQLTGRDEYFALACKALQPFRFDIREGGVTANLYQQRPFYEEYVAAEPTMVLDGHIFALFGIFDFVRSAAHIDSNSTAIARQLFEQGVASLIQWLPEFDMGYWVRFNLCHMPHYPTIDPCTVGYLRLIVAQLQILADLSRRSELLNFAKKFDKYDHFGNILRMYFVKYQALKQLNRV